MKDFNSYIITNPGARARAYKTYKDLYEVGKQVEYLLSTGRSLQESYDICALLCNNIPSYMSIYRFLKKYSEYNINISSNGSSQRTKNAAKARRIIEDTEVEKVREYYSAGKSLQVIGKMYGTTAATVMSFMERNNITRRSKSEVAVMLQASDPDYFTKQREKGILAYQKRRNFGTTPEIEFKQWLDASNIQYEEQYRKVGNKHPYDFFLPSLNLLVEIDGHYWHSKSKQIQKDKEQVKYANHKGYNVVRICTKELKESDGDYTKWIKI